MAKTNTDLIREVQLAVAGLTIRVEALQGQIVTETMRLTEAEKKTTDSVSDVRERLAVLEHMLVELKKTSEETDRRRWSLTTLFLGSLATLVVNVVLVVLRLK